MKKALAFILASFVFASIFFKSIPAKASDFAIPESGWLPVIYDIFYSLVNGNELDVAQIAGELSGISAFIDKYDEYRNTHFESGIEGSLSLLNNSLFTYASCMYEGDLYDLAAQYSIYLKDGLHPLLGRYTQDRVARWNQYNTQYNDKYLNSFAVDSDQIETNPDVNYLTYIDRLNESGFYFSTFDFKPNAGTGYNYTYYIFDINNYSWVSPSGTSSLVNFPSLAMSQYQPVACMDILNVNVLPIGNDNYSVSIPIQSINPCAKSNWNNAYYDCLLLNNPYLEPGSIGGQINMTYTISGSLQYVINDISNKFRNINLYVDSVPWSIVGNVIDPDLIIAPTVIRNDNGLIDSQDVFVPDQELAFDLIGLINLLEDALQNQDTISFDDIINDGNILRNPDGTALDDARSHILQNTIQRVIADEFERDDPDPIPTTTPPPYPTFPEVDWRKNPIPEPLPTGFDTSNGNPADAFSGASTLAQIVDATNRSLPSELVYTFWGIVFGMIVLGIIKVLHK